MGGIFGGKSSVIDTSQPAAVGVRIQTSAYGSPIPIIYGRTRVSANLIWFGDFAAIGTTTQQTTGGKGGGGVTQRQTTYVYQAAFAMALGEGPITSINAVWVDKDYVNNLLTYSQTSGPFTASQEAIFSPANGIVSVQQASGFVANTSVYGTSGVGDAATLVLLVAGTDYTVTAAGQYTFSASWRNQYLLATYTYNITFTVAAKYTTFLGTYPQTPWAYLTSAHPGQDLSYAGRPAAGKTRARPCR